MQVIIDIECNALVKPTKIWVVACKCVETGELHVFRNLTDDQQAKENFLHFASRVTGWIGHNILEYDLPVLYDLLGLPVVDTNLVTDTLILSRLVNYSRLGGHSIEQYGLEFGLEKGKFNDWSSYSLDMEKYCIRDVDICYRIYCLYRSIISDSQWQSSIRLEHRFQLICNDLHNNGFYFNSDNARTLLDNVNKELDQIDAQFITAFPPREVLIKEFTPKPTKFGTISKTSVPRTLWDRIHEYEVGVTYRHTRLEPFNPSSHKQLIEILSEANWQPEDKTKTHIETEREIARVKRERSSDKHLLLDNLNAKLLQLQKTGWLINENNLSTLPETAPAPARLLAKRILWEARRRTLTEWLGLVKDDGRIHGKFVGIGSWPHRMAHQNPNTANIPKDFNAKDNTVKLLGKELRELWCAPKKRLLVGVDAEGIQLRIFAHYINDPEFTDALVKGRKDDKTDPHSLNQRILGSICKTRGAAKNFIYALLLGGGLGKLSQLLNATQSETKEALDRLLQRYEGFKKLRKDVIPKDAKQGWFEGLDGRRIPIRGETYRDREHHAMSGYLQSGEAIVIKTAAVIINEALHEEKLLKKWMFVDIVHDELQSEVRNDMHLAIKVAKIKADAIKIAGERLGLRCPLAGSYMNDDKKYTIGKTWYATH